MSRKSAAKRGAAKAPEDGDAAGLAQPRGWFARDLSLGLLACLPLLVAYETATGASGGSWRNSAELAATLPLRLFEGHETLARRLLLLVLAFACVWRLYAPEYALVKRVAKIAGEGAAWALLFGPAVLVLHGLLGAPVPEGVASSAMPPMPGLARAGLVCGGAAWEELVFRVLLLALLARWAARFFEPLAGQGRATRLLAWGAALPVAGLCFAAAHLSALTSVFGQGGEHWDGALFAWRTLSGILLGVLYAWRGVGVAAWCHAVVNALLLVGATPGVFL